MGRLQAEARGARWTAAERDPDVSAHRDAGRRGDRAQFRNRRLHGSKGIGMNLEEGDTPGNKRDRDETDEHRPAPLDRLVCLVLFEEIDDSKVKALANG